MIFGDLRAMAFTLEEFARLGPYLGKEEDAVKLCAYADGIRRNISSQIPPEQKPSYDAYVAMSRINLEPVVFQATWNDVE